MKIDLNCLNDAKEKVLNEYDIDTNDLNFVSQMVESMPTTSNDVAYLSYIIKQIATQKGYIK